MKAESLNPPIDDCVDFSRRGVTFAPEGAGCYVLTNASGDIFYIGKAKSLKRRMGDHLDNDEKRGMTPLGVASVFHYALCEERQLSSLEKGWLNQFQMAEGGVLPHFNKIDA